MRFRLLWVLLGFIFPLFLCGAVGSGYYFYDTVRQYIAYGNLPDYGSVSPQGIVKQPAAAPVTSSMPNVAAGERVNVLLLGIDRREGEVGPWRTDTMIVATLDPKTKTAGMLSIPRDLYVPIPYPGLGENRINTANFYGALNKYPGGGPALAKKTVEYNLGIPVHFYVLIDFQGFKKIVDTLDGIDIDVPAPIDDPEYPTDDYLTQTIHIPAGHVHMDGDLALKYARTRHTTSDFDRSKRQMQILKAMRDKALKLDMLPKVPQLYAQFKDTIETDMTLQQMLALAPLAKEVRTDNIKSRAIDQTMTYEIRLNNGADVLWPIRDKIAVVVNEVFSAGETAPADNASPPKTTRIAVLNGTITKGLAERGATYLKGRGFNVVQTGNADRLDYGETLILDSGSDPSTLAALTKALSVSPANVRKLPMSTSDADIEIILGANWKPPAQ